MFEGLAFKGLSVLGDEEGPSVVVAETSVGVPVGRRKRGVRRASKEPTVRPFARPPATHDGPSTPLQTSLSLTPSVVQGGGGGRNFL